MVVEIQMYFLDSTILYKLKCMFQNINFVLTLHFGINIKPVAMMLKFSEIDEHKIEASMSDYLILT
jgi:hypothetical protein